MSDDFPSMVETIFSPFLGGHGFQLISSTDNHGEINLVFESPACKMRVYMSPRGGESNCLLGTKDATNSDDWLAERGTRWFYLRSLAGINAGLSVSELLALPPPRYASTREEVLDLSRLLEKGYQSFLHSNTRS